MKDEHIIISHLRQEESGAWVVQTLDEHARGVARLAALFAGEFGFGEWGRCLGQLHDMGKEKRAFQRHIRRASGFDPSLRGSEGPEKNHAYVGALMSLGMTAGCILRFPLAGHHTGLQDYGDLEEALRQPWPQDVGRPERLPALGIPDTFSQKWKDEYCHHLTRMLFSCLVDADYLDTEQFMNPHAAILRAGGEWGMDRLAERLDAHLARLKAGAGKSKVNEIRQRVQDECRRAAEWAPGCYSLAVPTGGGKTLSSLVWAVGHALRHGKRRVVVAIPFTSIIVQTAQVLRRIFGDEAVLEHHSAAEWQTSDEPEAWERAKLATENWDRPIIVTTNVQLFESVFASQPGRCRKLHNLCNAVLILDEVQSLPTHLLQPIVDAISCYQQLFGLSVLFTTASMPALSGAKKLRGIDHLREIIPAGWRLHDELRRVEIHFAEKEISTYQQVATRLAAHPRVLCVANTRSDALELFTRLPAGGAKFHLSRLMCAAHIRHTLERIREALAGNEEVVRVVSTQLVEAGVDIDFPVVFRQEAGLDSILQAAGRCNREGRLPGPGHTWVFSLNSEHALPRGYITQANQARLDINLSGTGADPMSPEAMAEYYNQLFNVQTPTFDKHDITNKLGKPNAMRFAEAAKDFRMIEDEGVHIVMPYDRAAELVEQWRAQGPGRELRRQLGQYTVCVLSRDFDKLKGLVEELSEGLWWLPERGQYSEQTGLSLENHWLEEILIK